jgi:hypothetical protein
MNLRRLASTVPVVLFLLASVAAAPACASKSDGTNAADASVCPASMPAQGDPCTAPLDTRCTFGDACTGAAFVCGKSATWQRGAFTSRCDGG